jgi:ribosomal protein L11 methyltransferase
VIRLAITVRGDDAGVVLAELLELSPAGVEEREVADGVEYAVYGPDGELPQMHELTAAAGDVLVSVTTEEVADDWDERWKAWHRPVQVGAVRVRPPWEPAAPQGGLELVVDPGQAFGTGAHPTTRLCLELMLELDPAGALVDLGCGSGILAIAAARLGWAPVLGLDHDLEAVRAARDNAAANGASVQVRRHDMMRDGPAPGAPTVLANLLRPLLLRVAKDGFAGPGPDALIVSGLLADEGDEVAAAFAVQGLREDARRQDGDWVALLLRR